MGRCYTNPEPEEIDYVIPSNDGDTNNDDKK